MFLEPANEAAVAVAPDPEPALADLLWRYVRAARGAFSGNTERAIRSDLALFAAWCAGQGLQALPASPVTIAGFVDAMAESRAPATVRATSPASPSPTGRSAAARPWSARRVHWRSGSCTGARGAARARPAG